MLAGIVQNRFQPNTFGYAGRPSNTNRGLANVWDLSTDYQFTRLLAATLYYDQCLGKRRDFVDLSQECERAANLS
jgi:hypothetical protein